MNLKIKTRTVGYNNKILVSDGKFSLGKTDKVNAFEPATMKSFKVLAQTAATHRGLNNVAQTAATHRDSNVVEQKPTITHEEEKLL